MRERRAHAAYFGYDFQVKAAIVIMLDNITEAKSLKLEGVEDIEIRLFDGKTVLAQAKAVEDTFDYSHVREKLKSALQSLSEGAAQVDASQLIMITNSPNPFNDPESRSMFWGANRCDYRSLPSSSRELIDNYLQETGAALDTDKFYVQRLPFDTDDEEERARATKDRIRAFLSKIMVAVPDFTDRLYDVWTAQLLFNGSVREKTLHIKKASFIWPIIVFETDISLLDDDIIEEFDEAQYQEIARSYHAVIDSHCDRYEFVSRVLGDYNEFEYSGPKKKKAIAFSSALWERYRDEFTVPGIPDETVKGLTRIILYSIVKRRIVIENIRKGANL